MSDREPNTCSLLRLPVEIRLQIYLLVIQHRVIHVRMKWTDNRAQDGFKYSCLEDTRPLQQRHERNLLSLSIPFRVELRVLAQVCRKMHEETTLLPFKTFIWAFETAFTLDQWVFMEHHIATECKEAIRTIAVPNPGPYRSSERVLLNLRELLLVGTAYSTTTYFTDPRDAKDMSVEIETLKKDKASGAWISGGARAKYAKDLFA